jgi:hypothetical protein
MTFLSHWGPEKSLLDHKPFAIRHTAHATQAWHPLQQVRTELSIILKSNGWMRYGEHIIIITSGRWNVNSPCGWLFLVFSLSELSSYNVAKKKQMSVNSVSTT